MLAVIALPIGLLLGLASGGRLRRLGDLKFKYEAALIIAFLLQGFARGRLFGVHAMAIGFGVWAVSSIVLLGLLILNYRTAGTLVTAVGVRLNLEIALINGAMPLSSELLTGLSRQVMERSAGFYQVATRTVIMPWLGDALRLDIFGSVYLLSPGDLLLLVGVMTIIVASMCEPASELLYE